MGIEENRKSDNFIKNLLPEGVTKCAENIPAPVTWGAAVVLTLGSVWGASNLWGYHDCEGDSSESSRSSSGSDTSTTRTRATQSDQCQPGSRSQHLFAWMVAVIAGGVVLALAL